MDDVTAFHQELYEEHLEEASFLYELRADSLNDEELTWVDLDDYDRRIEAHLDALLGGGFASLNMSLELALSGEPGDLYVAIRLACQGQTIATLLELLKKVEDREGPAFQAAATGLALGCPDTWFRELIPFIEEKQPHLLPILIRVLAWRRAPQGPTIFQRYRDRPDLRDHLSWADCRLPSILANYQIRAQLLSGEVWENRTDAALALLQTGDRELRSKLKTSEAWAHIPLALSGSQRHVGELLRATPVTTHSILALGLLGDMTAVEHLLPFIGDPAGAPSAALALNLITGANLREEVFIPEIVEEDDLFEEELEAYHAGEPTKNPNGNPAGEYVVRLCQNESTWRQWWHDHGSRFQADIRYRNGQPFTPGCLIDNLRAEQSPNMIRVLAHLECRIRYGFSAPFEPEMPIPQQRKTIQTYVTWLEEHGDRFTPGRWYFAGEPT